MTAVPDSTFVTGPNFRQVDASGVYVTRPGGSQTTLASALSVVAGAPAFTQSAPVALTTSVTLTAADVVAGLFTANQAAGAAATYTLPTGTNLAAALPSWFTTGYAFQFSLVNISTVAAEDATVQGNTGTTLVGSGFVASNAATTDNSFGTFLVRCTGTNTFSIYRVG